MVKKITKICLEICLYKSMPANVLLFIIWIRYINPWINIKEKLWIKITCVYNACIRNYHKTLKDSIFVYQNFAKNKDVCKLSLVDVLVKYAMV